MRAIRVRKIGLGLALGLAMTVQARAQPQDGAEAPPAMTLKIKDTLDIWRNTSGGLAVGDTSLDKLQVIATLDGEGFGRPGFTMRAQVFKTNGESLSGSRTGDIQTASNIEALNTVRLFEFWAQQHFGRTDAGGVNVRAGLIDLNATFDSIAAAGLFLNSSHGIGPDLSRSGRNGPSIFPVTSAGIQAMWPVSGDWSMEAAAFDGVPGDPAHPKAFAAARLRSDDGALLIAQADRRLGADAQFSIGAWDYTAPFDSIDPQARRRTARPGVYGFVEAPAPVLGDAQVWLRAGAADGRVQMVAGYLGAGVAWSGEALGREDDQFGLAVARAAIGAPSRRTLGLPRAETTWEATYSWRLNSLITLQPDVQYIVHPSLTAHLPKALAVGLRIVAQAKRPRWSATDDN